MNDTRTPSTPQHPEPPTRPPVIEEPPTTVLVIEDGVIYGGAGLRPGSRIVLVNADDPESVRAGVEIERAQGRYADDTMAAEAYEAPPAAAAPNPHAQRERAAGPTDPDPHKT